MRRGPTHPRSPTLPGRPSRVRHRVPARREDGPAAGPPGGRPLDKSSDLAHPVSDRRFGPVLSLVRQGWTLGTEFGAHSIEALLWVAETVEGSVYVPRSLQITATGLAFQLANPPLRVGAFRRLSVRVDGRSIDPTVVRVRSPPTAAWRTADSIDDGRPLPWVPGQHAEFEVDVPSPAPGTELTVRLELTSVAIPPLVWLEFRDRAEGALPA